MSVFQPPPTYADVVIVDPENKKPARFNPIWLKWFLDMARGATVPPAVPGTVTSVSGSGGTTGLTFSGGPITTTGTLTLGGILATTSGGSGNTTGTATAVAVGGITGLGTGVGAALAVNVGSAGAFVTFNGALGTPASGVATNLTGTAAGLTAGNATLAATVTTNANLTGVVTSVGNATAMAGQTYPLMNYGGLNFNGTTTYLDGNALTGIAEGKKFTWVWHGRFAGAAAAVETLRSGTGGRFVITRTATGNIGLVGNDNTGTINLSNTTTNTPCAAAGEYVVMISSDQAATTTPAQIVINGVAATVTNTTKVDSNIDFVVTENSLGGGPTGTALFAGDMYYVWFDALANMDFTVTNQRKFVDSNNVPVFLGSNGELPTGYIPISFNAYGNGSTVGRASWVRGRGANTGTYVEKGAIAAPTTILYGQQAPLSGVYTPTLTNVANVATTAYECQYFRDSSAVGGIQTVSGQIDADPTAPAAATQVGISLPFASAITAASQVGGTAFASDIAGQGAAIRGDAANDRAEMVWISGDITNQPMYFMLQARTL